MVFVCFSKMESVRKLKKYQKSIHFQLSDLIGQESKVVCMCACFHIMR